MPARSKSQRRYMGAAMSRKREGHPRASDPKMTLAQMEDYASTPEKGLVKRVKKGKGRK